MHSFLKAAQQDTSILQLQQWRTQHRDKRILIQHLASNQKTADHNASAKLEETHGKLQKMFADNAKAELY